MDVRGEVCGVGPTRSYRGKRLLDLAIVGLVALPAAAVGLLAALAIWLDDGRPVLFRQMRAGRGGRPFVMLKLRTMHAHGRGHSVFPDRDSCTRVGRWLRRLSVDELPQLFNVISGEMSLVGPRPQQAWEVATYTDWEGRRLRVRPGMTGLWQVSGRSQLSFDEAIRLDLYYVDNWSMVADLIIIAKTVKAVLRSQGAF
jgi:lipopolysaccharide/colanic/teichoic acid biosynthesis glycosyltransferase